jgi:hypothetical protein
MRYSITSAFAMSLRSGHTVSAGKIGTLEQGKVAQGDELWIAAQTTSTASAGDKWLRVKDLAGQPVDGWIAVIHLGKVYCTLTDNGDNPPVSKDSVKRIVKAVITYETVGGETKTKEVFPAQ